MNTKTKFSLQNQLIKYILNPISVIAEKIPQRTKDIVFTIAGTLIVLLYFIQDTALINIRYLYYFAAGCLLTGVMIICTVTPNMQPVKFKPLLIICWFLIAATMLYSGIFNSVDFLPEGVLFAIAYPIIFIVWNNNDTAKIFKKLINIIEISFIIYIIVSMLFFPMYSLRYSGIFYNINGTAGYLAIVFVLLLVKVIQEKKFSLKLVGHIILLGISFALLMYTSSRTGILEAGLSGAVVLLIYFLSNIKEKKLYFFRNLVLIAISALFFFNTAIYIFRAGIYLHIPSLNLPQNQHSENVGDENDLSAKASLVLTTNRVQPLEPDGSDSSMNNYSSGRMAIWSGYIKQLNLKGHPDSGTVTFTYGDGERTYHTTHMTILQLAYENGILSGLFYLLFNIFAGCCSVAYAFKHRKEKYACIPIAVTIAYGVHSLLATTTISFWYISALYYYLVQFPVMKKRTN